MNLNKARVPPTSQRPARMKPWVCAVMLAVVGLVMAFGPAQPATAARRPADPVATVLVLEIDGVIDPIVARYVERAMQVAQSEEAALVVIQLDTPGGLDSATRQIVQAILNSDVPVAVLVGPSGARAASAGVFITMAAHVAAMSPGTIMGAAHPLDLGQGELPANLEDKITNDAVAYIQAIAQQRGRNAEWAGQAVRFSASLTAQGALELGVVDLLAADVPELLDKLDGRRVTLVGGEEVTLAVAGATPEHYPLTWLEVIAHALVEPNIAYLLLSLGTLALLVEIYHPGAILPGVTGVIALVLAFVALGSLPVNWGGIMLIVVAFIFFIADIKVQGVALSIAGAISFVLGSLLLFSPFSPVAPTVPRLAVSPWLLVTMTALIAGFFGVVVTAAVRAQRRMPLMGPQFMTGNRGTLQTDLNPQGTVQLQSETWTAVAVQGAVAAGETVEVVGTDGLRLRVRCPD